MGCVCLDDYFIPSPRRLHGTSAGAGGCLLSAGVVEAELRCDFTQAVRSLCGNLGLLCIALDIVACHLSNSSFWYLTSFYLPLLQSDFRHRKDFRTAPGEN